MGRVSIWRRLLTALFRDRHIVPGPARAHANIAAAALYLGAMCFWGIGIISAARREVDNQVTRDLLLVCVLNLSVAIASVQRLRWGWVRLLFGGACVFTVATGGALLVALGRGAPAPSGGWLIGGAIGGPLIILWLTWWYSRSSVEELFPESRSTPKCGSRRATVGDGADKKAPS